MSETKQFEAGKTYGPRGVCAFVGFAAITVAARTAKTLTTDDGRRLQIRVSSDDIECVYPLGRKPFCPIVRAG